MDAQQRAALKTHGQLKKWLAVEAARMTDKQETVAARMLCCLSARAMNVTAPPTAFEDVMEFRRVFSALQN